jgi:ABC-type nitrate/sulfonate/bicarbonate transport system permease component
MAGRMVTAIRRHPVGVATFLAIVVGWEIAAHLVPESQISGSPIVPSWEFIFGPALKGLSDYWTFEYWAPRPTYGEPQTYLGAFLAIGYHSGKTLLRLLLGLTLGLITGVGSGLVVSYWPFVRRVAWAPLNFLRMTPLLAAIPLFQFWLGANTVGVTVFIAFGVWVLLLVATITAVANVPDRYVESARTLGASRLRTYVTVIVPGALPELRTSLLLAAGLSWSLTIGAEYLGLRDGLGAILLTAENFTNTGRMMVMALVLTVYALLSFLLLDVVAGKALSWMPTLEAQPTMRVAAGTAALGGTAATERDEATVP